MVIQDTRGRYASEGEFYAFRDDITDGYDSVEWCAAQAWSDGQVGMYGAIVRRGDPVAGGAERAAASQGHLSADYSLGLS